MLHAPNDDLIEVVRELARSTTPQELQSRGVRRVRSIGVDDLSLLIEKAINRTLLRRTIGGIDDRELDALVSETNAEFVAQLAEYEALGDSRERLERQRAKVRSDLDELRQVIAERVERDPAEQAAADEQRAHDLRLSVQALLLPLYDPDRRKPGVRRVAEQILGLFEESTRRALEERESAREREIEQLHRRVAKLIASLEATEKVLGEVAKMKDVEHGIASIYRTVQGLAQGDLAREKKRDALERIFQSNLTLRSLVAQG
jgi:chaperonin cofactor prefoldin